MTYLVVTLAALGGAGALLLLAVVNIQYRLSRHEVEVLLFRLRIRRVMFTDIRDVTEGAAACAEHWPSTLWPAGRALTLHRRSGWLRRVVITPRDRAHFRGQLESALGWRMGRGAARTDGQTP
jgi:hypothetical protein